MRTVGIAFLEARGNDYIAHILLPGWEQVKLFRVHTRDEQEAKESVREMSGWFILFEEEENLFKEKVRTLLASPAHQKPVQPVPARKSGHTLLPPPPEVVESIPGMLSQLNTALKEYDRFNDRAVKEGFEAHIRFYRQWFRQHRIELVQLTNGLYELKNRAMCREREEEYTDYREQIIPHARETIRLNSRGSKSPMKW